MTFLGITTILISLMIILLRPKALIYLLMLFCGFTGSGAIIVGNVQLNVPHLIAILLLSIYFFEKILKCKFTIFYPSKYLTIFLFFICLTSFAPLFISNRIWVLDVHNNYTYLHYSLTNITQLMYFLLCYFFYFYIYNLIKSDTRKDLINKIVHYYCLGVIVVCLLCVYQIIAFKLNLPFDSIFRDSILGNIQGTRIYGPCGEASMLAYYLLSGLPLLIRVDWNKVLRMLSVVFCIGIGVISFSSTFFVGFMFWIAIEGCFNKNKIIFFIKKHMLTFIIITTIAVVTIVGLYDVIYEYLGKAILKFIDTINLVNESGNERWNVFMDMINVAAEYPITGIGFGSSRSKDLFSTWFANIGFVGMGLLFVYLAKILKKDVGKYNFMKLSIFLVWISMMISVPEPYGLFVWLFLAIIDGYSDQDDMVSK